MEDTMMMLSGKLRVDAAQWTSGMQTAAKETRTTADQMVASMDRVSKASQATVHKMTEASAAIAASSWAARRAAEQEADTRKVVASTYKQTTDEIKKHRTWEQVSATQRIKLLQAEGWAAKRAAEQQVEAYRNVGRAAEEMERKLTRAQSLQQHFRNNNALGGSGRPVVDNPFTFGGRRGGTPKPSGTGFGNFIGGTLGGGTGLGAAMRFGAPAAAGLGVASFGLGEYMEGEKVITRLNSVLRATQGQAGRTAEQMKNLAGEMQATTIYSDTAALKAQTFLATLDGISGDNFDDAMRSAADLASVMEIDLESAAHMVGRALQDPENGLRALASAGVKFTDQQKEQIKTLIEAGDVASAQRVILDELASRMGGAAADAAGTLSGRLKQATNDVATLGGAITDKLLNPLQAIADLDKSVGESIASMIDPEAAKGLGGKFDDPAFRRDRQLRAYLSTRDLGGMETGIMRDQQGNLRLNAEGIAQQTKSFDALSAEERAQFDFESEASKQFDMTGRWDKRTDAQKTDDWLKQNARDIDARQRRETEEAWQREKRAQEISAGPMGKRDRAVAFAASAEGRAALGNMTSAQGSALAGNLAGDVKALAPTLQNTGTRVGVNGQITGPQATLETQVNIDATLERYRAMFQQMPQFSAEAYDKIEAQIRDNLLAAARASDEQRDLFLTNAQKAAEGAAKMFEDYDRNLAEEEKKAREAERYNVAAIDPAQLPSNLRNFTRGQAGGVASQMANDIEGTLRPDENGAIDNSQLQTILDNYKLVLSQMPGFSEPIFKQIEAQVVASAKGAMESTGAMRATYLQTMKDTLAGVGGIIKPEAAKGNTTQAQDQSVYYAGLGAASKNDLGGQVQQRMANLQQAKAAAASPLGIGTPEQKKGLVELARLQAETMKRIRDSTGETRQKNIEELQRLDEAWQKAFGAIRDGSKKTVEELTKDAEDQGDALSGAADKAAKGRSGSSGASGGGQFGSVGEMMSGITQMSQALSGMFTGALSGVGNAGAAFGEYLNSITDPVEKIDAQIDNAKGRLRGAMLNASGFGAVGGTTGLEQEIKALEAQRAKVMKERDEARKEAFKKDREQKLGQRTADEANTVQLVGARAQTDLYGPGFRQATTGEKTAPTSNNLSVSVVVNGPVDPDGMLQILDDAAKRAGWDKSGRSFIRSANGRV